MSQTSFAGQWFRWNAAAWSAGFILYNPIAHGITGSHGRDLTTAQLAAHSAGLAFVGIVVAAAQRRVLGQYVPVSLARVAVAPVGFIVAFWVGYYQPVEFGPDTDILLGFLVLGGAVWLGRVPTKGHHLAAAVALLGFPSAALVVEVCLIVVFSLLHITPALQTSTFQHSLFWIVVGGGTGVLGGWLSGLALSRMLLPPEDSSLCS